MKTWIAKEVVSKVGFEDEVLIDMIFNMLTLDEVRYRKNAYCIGD